jgi:hypothetical protein
MLSPVPPTHTSLPPLPPALLLTMSCTSVASARAPIAVAAAAAITCAWLIRVRSTVPGRSGGTSCM